jgi:hypothetical protein
MSKSEINDYFHNLWPVLTDDQKQSVLSVMKSFIDIEDESNEETHDHFQEPESQYNVPFHLFTALKKKQRKALISFIEASGVGGQTIEEYNRELDEAEAEIERGEFYTHEEVMEKLNKRFSGK